MRAPETARRTVAVETRALLSGNEAIARGAWEAGVRVAAGYPGLVVDEQEAPDPLVGSWSVRPLPIIATSVRVAGSPVAANVVALGVLVGATGVVEPRALERAVAARVPPRSRELNLKALAAGVRLAGVGAS